MLRCCHSLDAMACQNPAKHSMCMTCHFIDKPRHQVAKNALLRFPELPDRSMYQLHDKAKTTIPCRPECGSQQCELEVQQSVMGVTREGASLQAEWGPCRPRPRRRRRARTRCPAGRPPPPGPRRPATAAVLVHVSGPGVGCCTRCVCRNIVTSLLDPRTIPLRRAGMRPAGTALASGATLCPRRV